MEFGIVFHRQGGKMGVIDQVSARPGRPEQLLKKHNVIRARVQWSDLRVTEPLVYKAQGRFNIYNSAHDGSVC